MTMTNVFDLFESWHYGNQPFYLMWLLISNQLFCCRFYEMYIQIWGVQIAKKVQCLCFALKVLIRRHFNYDINASNSLSIFRSILFYCFKNLFTAQKKCIGIVVYLKSYRGQIFVLHAPLHVASKTAFAIIQSPRDASNSSITIHYKVKRFWIDQFLC